MEHSENIVLDKTLELGSVSRDTAGSAGPQMEAAGYYLKTGLNDD